MAGKLIIAAVTKISIGVIINQRISRNQRNGNQRRNQSAYHECEKRKWHNRKSVAMKNVINQS
jgi:hypothetical protein